MPKQPRLSTIDAARMLKQAGFSLLREKGSHPIFAKRIRRVVVPFHAGNVLHPRIVRQVLDTVAGE